MGFEPEICEEGCVAISENSDEYWMTINYFNGLIIIEEFCVDDNNEGNEWWALNRYILMQRDDLEPIFF